MEDTMANFLPLPTTVGGSIFRVDSAYYGEELVDVSEKSITIRANNISGNWVDVSVDRGDGFTVTGHLNNGDSGGFTEALIVCLNKSNKITRWRPGAFGIPGNGGGEIFFEVPQTADSVVIEISVTG